MVPASWCQELAKNVLGLDMDEEASAEEGQDAINELLNVIGGQFLTNCYGEKPMFHLSIPEVKPCGWSDWEELFQQEGTLKFLVEDVPILILLQCDQTK